MRMRQHGKFRDGELEGFFHDEEITQHGNSVNLWATTVGMDTLSGLSQCNALYFSNPSSSAVPHHLSVIGILRSLSSSQSKILWPMMTNWTIKYNAQITCIQFHTDTSRCSIVILCSRIECQTETISIPNSVLHTRGNLGKRVDIWKTEGSSYLNELGFHIILSAGQFRGLVSEVRDFTQTCQRLTPCTRPQIRDRWHTDITLDFQRVLHWWPTVEKILCNM